MLRKGKEFSLGLLMFGTVMGSEAFAFDVEIEEVVSTQSRSEKPLKDQLGNITLITADDIDNVQATHFSELALRVSGINFARNNGQEYLGSIRSPIFTGAGACGAFLMAQDGIALRSAGFCNINELFEAVTEQAERIEIIKGPGSALYGSNALHGMINIISAKADSDEGFLSIEGGAHDFIRFNGAKGITGKKHGLRVAATVTHDGGYRDQSGYDQQKISLRHDYTGEIWEVASNLTLTNLDQETAGYITGFEAYKDREIAKKNPNPEAYRKAKSLRYWSQLSRSISDNIRWQVTPYARFLDMDFLMHFLPGKPLEENSQSSFGIQNGFYFNEGENIDFVVGGDIEYSHGSLLQIQENPTMGSAFLQATIPSGKQYDYDVSSIMAAGFIQGDWAIQPELHVIFGARLEYINYDYSNNMVSGRTKEDGTLCGFGGCRYSRPESRKDNFTTFSPKLGILYHYTDQHDVYVNLSQGYRAPQTAELYRLQRAQTVAELETVNVKSAELGFKGKDRGITYNISFYAMKKDNYIFRDSSFFNVDNGKSDHIGTDVMVGIELGKTLSLRGNVSFARHRYTFDYVSNGINLNKNKIDTAPTHFGSLQVTWRPIETTSVELEWVHMGPYYLDPENIHQYGGHNYLNLRGKVKVSEKLDAFFRVKNLSNVKYAERADYTTFTDERYFPGMPRSFYAGLRLNF